jgi:chemotaxis signal transduction protein/nucleoid-associated protein YgaU
MRLLLRLHGVKYDCILWGDMRELIAIDFGDGRYGVWRDEVQAEKETDCVHSLPLSPKHFSGVCDIEGRTAVLFDLAVSLGHRPFDRSRAGRIFVLGERENIEGFVFNAETEVLRVSSDEMHSMPDYMNAPEIDTCVVRSGETIIVLNIIALYGRVRADEWIEPEFAVQEAGSDNGSASVKNIGVFGICGEEFAVAGDLVETEDFRPEHICRLPFAPPHVEGIAYHKGCISAVVNVAGYLGLNCDMKRPVMLMTRPDGLGLLVDAGGVLRASEDIDLRPLPPLACSGLMRSAVMSGGNVIPVLNPRALISETVDEALQDMYAPDSGFHSRMGNEDVDVVEFSILGERYALPEEQVEDVLDFSGYRCFPVTRSLMLGVAEHGGELLPVLDIGVCFGVRSEPNRDRRMICIANGDFRALVLAEDVFPKRTLSIGIQHRMSVRYLYGCYSDTDRIRLILNIESLTTRFDRKMVGELFDAMPKKAGSPGVGLTRRSFGYDTAGARTGEDTDIKSQPSETTYESQKTSVDHATLEKKYLKTEAIIGKPEAEESAEEVTEEPVAKESVEEVTEEPVAKESVEEVTEEPEAKESVEEVTEEPEAKESVEEVTEEPEAKESVEEVTEEPEAEEFAERVTEEPEAEEFAERVTEEPEAKESAEMVPEENVEDVIERDVESFVKVLDRPEYRGVHAVKGRRAGRDRMHVSRHRRWPVYAAIAAVVVAVYLAGVFMRSDDVKILEQKEEYNEAPITQDSGGKGGPEPGIESAGEGEPGRTAVRHGAASSLITETGIAPVPARENVPTESQGLAGTYEVREGDTLWHISERFTGEPFNYPYIANNNEIYDPDLIFPGQKIIISPGKEAEEQ